MVRRFALPLLLLLGACDSQSDDDVDAQVEAVVEATADVAVFFCECSLQARGDDPAACEAAADEVLGDEVVDCIRPLADDPAAREIMRCNTRALRDLVACYEQAGICPEDEAVSSPGEDVEEDGPISDDACGRDFETAIDACGDLPAETEDALSACLSDDRNEDCTGDGCG